MGIAHLMGGGKVLGTKTYSFQFRSPGLSSVVQKDLQGKQGDFAVYIEDLTSGEKYDYNGAKVFPAASLYKLVLMAAVLKEVEGGRIKLDDTLSSNKAHLTQVLGGEDFGYEDAPDPISYSVDEALSRVGRISDNFAAIMLTEKLRQLPDDGLLYKMAKDLGMDQTDFSADPINTTALDVGHYFGLLYQGKVVSPSISEKIVGYLGLSKINDRIPAGVPDNVRVVHKTGELAHVRHDAGIVYLEGRPYILVMLSQNIPYEDDGIDNLVQISKDVYNYFAQKH